MLVTLPFSLNYHCFTDEVSIFSSGFVMAIYGARSKDFEKSVDKIIR